MTNPEIKKFAYKVLRHSQGSDPGVTPELTEEFEQLKEENSLEGITRRVHGWLSIYFSLPAWKEEE